MIDALNYAPIAATAFAVPQFLPQILKLRATRDTAGVSWAWATLTCLNNAAWIAYFALEHYWTALVPSSSATVLAGTLAVLLSIRGQARLRPSILISVWAAMLVAAYLVLGRTGLGALLTAAFAVQVTPSIWTAYAHGPPDRHLLRDLAAHPRRTLLLADLRPVQVRSAADHPRPHRRDGQHAHARPDPPRSRERPRHRLTNDRERRTVTVQELIPLWTATGQGAWPVSYLQTSSAPG